MYLDLTGSELFMFKVYLMMTSWNSRKGLRGSQSYSTIAVDLMTVMISRKERNQRILFLVREDHVTSQHALGTRSRKCKNLVMTT